MTSKVNGAGGAYVVPFAMYAAILFQLQKM
jgi:hypothetical protein